MKVWPLTIYWEHGDKRDDLAARTEEEAEAMADYIYKTWNGVLAVHVEDPVEDEAEIYEII